MKRLNLSIFLMISAVILFSSCDETETFDDKWKQENETQFAAIAANAAYTKLNSQSGNGFVMYKEIESGEGATPYFTDQVKVLYTGWYKSIWSEPDTYLDDKGNTIYNKIIFDSTSNRNDIPSTMVISNSSVPDGLMTALQHMQVGDKWEVWIPWKLGYGEAGNSSIKGYTTLVFEIELVAIVE